MNYLYSWDTSLYRAINWGWHTPFLDVIMMSLTNSGDGWGQYAVMLVAIAIPKTRRLGFFVLACTAIAGIIRQPIMLAVARQRPSNFAFAHTLQDFTGYSSFPSGHTTASFAMAISVFLYTRKTHRAWCGWLALAWACAVGFSRIYVGVHYPSDVLGGIALATVICSFTYVLFNRYNWLRPAPKPLPSSGD